MQVYDPFGRKEFHGITAFLRSLTLCVLAKYIQGGQEFETLGSIKDTHFLKAKFQ